ncbi:hypothetical protein MML48_4g00004245 [Holotrichia oblita]|uniref:Uncharacterized protein n=1 Tax=Holotrichia oblita TaxID=644536 RepID=A0ACB9T8T0_HOLOL|nr:hypothetical protein MML48_4g00004245 [Holotrichia oblita]
MTDTIKILRNLRDRALRDFRSWRSSTKWDYYKMLRNYTNTAINNERKAFIEYNMRAADRKNVWAVMKSAGFAYSRDVKIPSDLLNLNTINSHFVNSVHRDLLCSTDLLDYYNNNSLMQSKFSFTLISESAISAIIDSIRSKSSGWNGLNITMISLACPPSSIAVYYAYSRYFYPV